MGTKAPKVNNVPGVIEGYCQAPEAHWYAATRGHGDHVTVLGWRLYATGVFAPWPITDEVRNISAPYTRGDVPMIQNVGGIVRHIVDHPGCEGGDRKPCGAKASTPYLALAEQWLCEMGILEAQGVALYPFPVALDFLAPLGGCFPRGARFEYRQLADLLVELEEKAKARNERDK